MVKERAVQSRSIRLARATEVLLKPWELTVLLLTFYESVTHFDGQIKSPLIGRAC